MNTVKLRKALQIKNRLAGEIANLTRRLNVNNHPDQDGKAPEFDIRALLAERKELVNKLVQVKTVIAKANVDIYEKINQLAELKSEVSVLSLIPTQDVRGNKRVLVEGRYDYLDTVTPAVIKSKEVQEKVTALNLEIESLQDAIDYHNSVTDVVVPE